LIPNSEVHIATGIIMQQDDAVSDFTHSIHDQPNAMRWELLKDPAYSPDLSTCEFHIFWPLKEALEDRTFMWDIDVSCGRVV
jgi:hypothetical protein